METNYKIILCCVEVLLCVMIHILYALQNKITEQHKEFEKKFDKAVSNLMKEIKSVEESSDNNDDHDTQSIDLNKK